MRSDKNNRSTKFNAYVSPSKPSSTSTIFTVSLNTASLYSSPSYASKTLLVHFLSEQKTYNISVVDIDHQSKWSSIE
jgi:hypothetical protein